MHIAARAFPLRAQRKRRRNGGGSVLGSGLAVGRVCALSSGVGSQGWARRPGWPQLGCAKQRPDAQRACVRCHDPAWKNGKQPGILLFSSSFLPIAILALPQCCACSEITSTETFAEEEKDNSRRIESTWLLINHTSFQRSAASRYTKEKPQPASLCIASSHCPLRQDTGPAKILNLLAAEHTFKHAARRVLL